MNEKKLCSHLRHEFSTSGWVLLLYYGIMNLAVSIVLAADIAIRIVSATLFDEVFSDAFIEEMVNAAATNGWGYLIAMAIGAVLLYVWKKREFCLQTIWQKEKPMTASAFFSIAAIFIGVQAVAQVLAIVLEWFFNLFGLSILDALESASVVEDTVSMFLYAAIFAPIGEEILFRGLLLRMLQKYGKKFAILATAFLFGIFHGNIIQTPYAFLVGLVLGYVTVEYSVVWAIVLHMINNMVLADFMTRLAEFLPPGVGDLISIFVIWSCAIAAVIVLLVKRHAVAQYLRQKKIHPLCVKSFFTSPGVLVLTGIMVGNILLTFILQLFV